MSPEFLAIDYRHPAFSAAMLLLVVAAVAILNHFVAASKKRRQERKLTRFLSGFDSIGGGKDYRALLASQPDSFDSLMLLADICFKSGQYAESIHIYLALLEIAEDKPRRIEAMTRLGKSYHKAGFYQRSRDILLESLKLKARNKEALELLLIIYDQTKEYNRALEVADALEEFGLDYAKERSFLKAKAIKNDPLLSDKKREAALIALQKEEPRLFAAVFEFVLTHNPANVWRIIDADRIIDAIDLFWRLPKASFNENEALKYPLLRELYTAKGWLDAASESAVFEFDLLIRLGENRALADLSFEYRCPRCAASLPIRFLRCPNCQRAEIARVESTLVKNAKNDGENYDASANFY
ncbi:MAG: tetratricopeptide repeat protein [Helicobacteraceae bacterium]|jgi:tetratricopeptide (TPR) repeat protein|nr:tetratricopeptide repeat protein [Helicobacteraceae bacterium]